MLCDDCSANGQDCTQHGRVVAVPVLTRMIERAADAEDDEAYAWLCDLLAAYESEEGE